ncbi:MAG: ClpXP protease specificity-enhancing factor [Gammaproteobacteria bacterium]
MTSIRPYLIRAIYEWILDNNFTPQITVDALLPGVQVPEKYVEEGKIVLNISPQAVNKLLINNEIVEFDARFSGVVWHINVPIAGVIAIYARENGRGMIFTEQDLDEEGGGDGEQTPPEPTSLKTKSIKPHLKIVK